MERIIIGAGILGLATGYQILKKSPNSKVVILEKEIEPALHQTGRNSGVIHSGIYYKPGSLKAKNCLAGKLELLEFCKEFGIPTPKLGKVIVAAEKAQIPMLNTLFERGKANGVEVKRVCPSELKEIEPHVFGLEALWLPEVSIVSFKEVAQTLAQEFLKMGGEIYFQEEVQKIIRDGKKVTTSTKKREYSSDLLINCGGLFSDRLARMALGKSEVTHRILPFRGEYYQVTPEKKGLVKGLIYPVPDPRFPFLGVHFTPMVGGKVEAGPNAILALAREGYRKGSVNLDDCLDIISFPGFWKVARKYWRVGAYEMVRSISKKLFLRDLQKLIPEIQGRDLIAGGAGIRAQLVTKEGKFMDDFHILEEENMVHVLNAPSPAATASFAIGKHIAEIALKNERKL